MAANNSDDQHIGVYKNARLMHACTSIVGYTVHLQTKEGRVWEGIFGTFSPDFTICLQLAVQIDPKLNSKDCLYAALKSGSQAQEKAFFDLKDIVRISAIDVDLNYATKDLAKLTTDADISGYDANKSTGEHKELESWQDDDGDDIKTESMLSLDDVAAGNNGKNDSRNSSRGWDAQDMFRYNERVHKVTTTYDEKLTDYTVPLPRHRSKEWLKKQERATAIAKEIESNTKSQSRLAKEDEGDCEEEKFSAVIRPIPPASTNPQSVTQAPSRPSPAHKPNTEIAPDNTQQQQRQQPLHPTPQPPNQQQQHHQQHNQLQHHHQPHHHQSQHHQQQQAPTQHHQHQQNDDLRQTSPATNQHYMNKPAPTKIYMNNQNGTYKNQRQRDRLERSKLEFKNFSKQLNLGPSPRQSQNQMQGSPSNQSQPQSHQQPQQKQSQQPQHPQHHHLQNQSHAHSQPPQISHHGQQQPQQQQPPPPPQIQASATQQPPPPPTNQQPHQSSQQTLSTQPQVPQSQVDLTTTNTTNTTTGTASTVNTSAVSERSDTSSVGNQSKDHQSELARNSKLNPNAKEFVYKPRSPAANQGAQTNGANQAPAGGPTAIDPANSSPMPPAPHAPYYPQVPMFPHGMSPHQQQHHAAQFMNHTHPHFQNQIHYMSPVPPHFAQQMPQPRYIRSNFQNYHRGEHHSNVRPDYTQASLMAPTSTGQPFVPPPSGAPHPMNAYASPQQPMLYSGPPQSMYPVVQAGFAQHMAHVMPNPPPYDGSAVYMQPQNYIVNP